MKKQNALGMMIGGAALVAVVLLLVFRWTGRQGNREVVAPRSGDEAGDVDITTTAQVDVAESSDSLAMAVASPSAVLPTSPDEVSTDSVAKAAPRQAEPRSVSAIEDVRQEVRARLLQGETKIEQAVLVQKAGELWGEYWPTSFDERPRSKGDDADVAMSTVPLSIRHSIDSSASMLARAFQDPASVDLAPSEARSLMALSLLASLGGADGCREFLRERMMASEPNRGDAFVFHSINADLPALASGSLLFLDDIRAFRDAQNPVYQLLAVRATLHAWSGSPGELSTESEAAGSIVLSARLAFLKPLLDAPDPFVRAQAKEAILSLGTDEAIAAIKDPR